MDFLVAFWSKNIRKIVKKIFFLLFLPSRQKVKKQHFYTKNFDAEFEKEVFLHIGPDPTIKKLIFS